MGGFFGGSGIDLRTLANTWAQAQTFSAGISIASGQTLDWNGDLKLNRDAANVLAQRSLTAPQALRVYNTTDAGLTNYERAVFDWTTVANRLTIGPVAGGTGTLRSIGLTSHLLWNTDNTYDIGASGATRPRNVYVGSQLFCNSMLVDQYIYGVAKGGFYFMGDGVIRVSNAAGTDFNRIQFGGTGNLHPAIKRSATVLQARLADDSAFAPLQGSLRTAANATTGLTAGVLSALTNASIVVTDASGQDYRIPCII